MRGHDHKWAKTGEFYATNDPKWWYACWCGAKGYAQDGKPIIVLNEPVPRWQAHTPEELGYGGA